MIDANEWYPWPSCLPPENALIQLETPNGDYIITTRHALRSFMHSLYDDGAPQFLWRYTGIAKHQMEVR